MEIQEVFDTVRDDLEAVERDLLAQGTGSRVEVLSQVGRHILSGGGKRFRPVLTLLVGRLCGTPPERRVPLAVSIELIHNATLLHDDIVDEAVLRRGKTAAHLLWGDTAGVLAANYHFSRAFSLILEAGGLASLRLVTRTLNEIVEGELFQFLRVGYSGMDEAQYRQIIERKTACLISAACRVGALPALGEEGSEPMARYGTDLGMAFQMTDDLLDYTAREEELGKEVGTDFREGKFTLPLISALRNAGERDREALLEMLRGTADQRREAFPRARELIERHGGFAYTYEAARRHVEEAARTAAGFPPGREREALVELARFVLQRAH